MIALWLAGCAKREPLPAASLWAPPMTLTYTEHASPGGMPPQAVVVTEVTEPSPDPALPDGWTGTVWQTTTTRADGGATEVTRYVVSDRGVAYFATLRGHVARMFEPKLALPAEVRVGDAWTGEHGQGPDHNTRACVAERTPFCKDGVATTCVTTWADRRAWMRQHWCRDLGWVAYEAVYVPAGGIPLLVWSTDASRDGTPLPSVSIDDRMLPPVDEVLGDAATPPAP